MYQPGWALGFLKLTIGRVVNILPSLKTPLPRGGGGGVRKPILGHEQMKSYYLS